MLQERRSSGWEPEAQPEEEEERFNKWMRFPAAEQLKAEP